MHSTLGRILVAAAALALTTFAGVARADGQRARVGVHVAGPGVGVHYQSRPYGAPPRVYATPRTRYYGPSVYLGVPLWAPPAYYGSPWYGGGYWYGPGYTTVVPVPSQPPVYIERGQDEGAPAPEAAAPAQGWWYWCTDPEGYYPTVRECPGGWQQVAPQPAARP